MNEREAWTIAVVTILLAPFLWLLDQCGIEVKL